MDTTLYALDLAIQTTPQAAIHYLLRGEYWLIMGDVYQARTDLLQVCDLAAQARDRSDWGYVFQSYLDRAEEMLTKIG